MGHAAAAMLRGFADRIASREDARTDGASEWTDLPIKDGEAYCIDTREGRLVRVHSEGTWILFMCWPGHDARVLTRGKRGHVERYAQEVLCYGLPGGPAYQGEALVWKQVGDDATLHGVTVGGEFRLMPLHDGRHLLLFARNDYTVLVLAIGERAALQRDAEDHLLDFRGDGLRARLGDGKVDLHGLGVGSVVAYLSFSTMRGSFSATLVVTPSACSIRAGQSTPACVCIRSRTCATATSAARSAGRSPGPRARPARRRQNRRPRRRLKPNRRLQSRNRGRDRRGEPGGWNPTNCRCSSVTSSARAHQDRGRPSCRGSSRGYAS